MTANEARDRLRYYLQFLLLDPDYKEEDLLEIVNVIINLEKYIMGTHSKPEWPEKKNVVKQPEKTQPKAPTTPPPGEYKTPKKMK